MVAINNDLKEIICKFIKIDKESLSDDTIIDSSVLSGSVLFHRMISRINDLYDIEIINYTLIKTFGDLKNQIREIKTEDLS